VSASLRVLVTGAQGQAGSALLASAPSAFVVRGVGHAELDISRQDDVDRHIDDFRPGLVINAAAYTAVDRAEAEQEAAARINVEGAANLARAAAAANARLIHISTDFVFDGQRSSPYRPEDEPAPLCVYGATKLAGERAVRAALPGSATIVRTAWVYAATGHNFVRTMLRLMRERGRVSVVADQVGTPTSAASLAEVLWQFAAKPDLSGTFHWTDAGVASWYDFAVAIAEEAAAAGLLSARPVVEPIASQDYPTAARRPAYSVLDKRTTLAALGVRTVHWRERLRTVIQELSRA
jgi:dTDP-4-dehydrorhamnose reductase